MAYTENYYAPDLDPADSMPPADPALLASANRMLSDRLNRIAEALRATGITSLNSIEDGEDLTPHVDWLIVRHFDAIHGIGKQQALIDILKRNFESKERECEALRKWAEAANERAAERPVVGYAIDENRLPPFEKIFEARKAAEDVAVSSGMTEVAVYELRLVGTAKRAAEWVPA